MSACSSCGAEIRWGRTSRGKNIPLDPAPVDDGNVEIVQDGPVPIVRVRPPGESRSFLDPDAPRYVTHFVTCPDAAEHRR